MPSHLSADRPPAQRPGRGTVDALLSRARRPKGEGDAGRRDAPGAPTDPRGRWERALSDLAPQRLRDLDEHSAQLRDGPPGTTDTAHVATAEPDGGPHGSLLGRVGSAEWNLLTDEAGWSGELYRILGLDPAAPALTLDELPSLVLEEDRPLLTALVTGCLVDARPVEGEFRIVRPDRTVRTVHMMGEPVLDADGATASMWAVLRDVGEPRRGRSAVRETRDSPRHHRPRARTGHRLAVESREAVPPPWRGSPRLPRPGGPALDLAAHRPAGPTGPAGGEWCDTLELLDGDTVLGVGGLAGGGSGGAPGPSMLLGALRGMAMAGSGPGRQLTLLNRLLGTTATARPALGGAVCCRYRPGTRTLVWARAGHPAPLLFRGGTGRALAAPDGTPLGAAPDTAYGQAEETLEPGDLLLLHTGGPAPGHGGTDTVDRLLGLAPRFRTARGAQDCVRAVVEEFGGSRREGAAWVLVARVTS
ncbi:SpoIIE family protein phosphatase [Streptomyces sp. NPDC015220]|uniref:SpoIIE family protein phosphatase n=1 Tax=Streptomyces sp. NPDC015220 TaxID=3364947 RepID=UPI00370143C1